MGWKKPADPVDVNFHARTTQAERDALDAIVARWAEKQAALGASASGVTTIAWFRQTVRRLAAEEGIPVNDPKPPPQRPALGASMPPRGKGPAGVRPGGRGPGSALRGKAGGRKGPGKLR
jgi:hypothetical protein